MTCASVAGWSRTPTPSRLVVPRQERRRSGRDDPSPRTAACVATCRRGSAISRGRSAEEVQLTERRHPAPAVRGHLTGTPSAATPSPPHQRAARCVAARSCGCPVHPAPSATTTSRATAPACGCPHRHSSLCFVRRLTLFPRPPRCHPWPVALHHAGRVHWNRTVATTSAPSAPTRGLLPGCAVAVAPAYPHGPPRSRWRNSRHRRGTAQITERGARLGAARTPAREGLRVEQMERAVVGTSNATSPPGRVAVAADPLRGQAGDGMTGPCTTGTVWMRTPRTRRGPRDHGPVQGEASHTRWRRIIRGWFCPEAGARLSRRCAYFRPSLRPSVANDHC